MTKKKLAEVKDKSDHPTKRLQLGAYFFHSHFFELVNESSQQDDSSSKQAPFPTIAPMQLKKGNQHE